MHNIYMNTQEIKIAIEQMLKEMFKERVVDYIILKSSPDLIIGIKRHDGTGIKTIRITVEDWI